MADAAETYKEWIGGREERDDVLTLPMVRRFLAMMDDVDTKFANGDALPPLWHWMLFTPEAPMREIDVDGHPKRGGFLPPVELPARRMWAGSRVRVPRRRCRLGAPAVRREGRIESGASPRRPASSGRLVFVTVMPRDLPAMTGSPLRRRAPPTSSIARIRGAAERSATARASCRRRPTGAMGRDGRAPIRR